MFQKIFKREILILKSVEKHFFEVPDQLNTFISLSIPPFSIQGIIEPTRIAILAPGKFNSYFNNLVFN